LERDHIKSAANMSAKISSIDEIIPIGDITRNGRLRKHKHLFKAPVLKPKHTYLSLLNDN
jgi:hypothetical protein